MRQEQLPEWLVDFAEKECKVVQASYLDAVKEMIERRSDKKFATIDDALDDFCTRMDIPRPDTNTVTAGFVVVAFSREDIDKMVAQGMPAEAIMNELGNTPEEKDAIAQYVKERQVKQQEEDSQIVKDISLTEDQAKPVTNMQGPGMTRSLSLNVRGLSKKAEDNYYVVLIKTKYNSYGEPFSKTSQWITGRDFSSDSPLSFGTLEEAQADARDTLSLNQTGAFQGREEGDIYIDEVKVLPYREAERFLGRNFSEEEVL